MNFAALVVSMAFLCAITIALAVKRKGVGAWCARAKERWCGGGAWKHPRMLDDDSLQEGGAEYRLGEYAVVGADVGLAVAGGVSGQVGRV